MTITVKKIFRNYYTGSDAWGFPNSLTTSGFASAQKFPRIQHQTTLYGGLCSITNYLPYYAAFGTGSVFADFIETEKGVLRSITYPTGGKTTFEYQGNQGNEAGVGFYGPAAVGGLRIKKIKNYDVSSNLASTKWYTYGKNETGIGIARGTNANNYFGYRDGYLPSDTGTGNDRWAAPDIYSYSQTIKHYKPGPNELPLYQHETGVNYKTDYTETKTTWLTQPRYGVTYANGSPIYYEQVTEHYSDHTDNTTGDPSVYGIGKTIYHYEQPHVHGHGYGQVWGNTNRTGIHMPWQLGKLKSVTDMKPNAPAYMDYDTIRHKTYDHSKFLRPEKIYYGADFR